MSISEYCFKKGMNADEYQTFKANIETITNAITQTTKETKGMYFPISDIIHYASNSDMRALIINQLKKHGFEFIEDYTLYRV